MRFVSNSSSGCVLINVENLVPNLVSVFKILPFFCKMSFCSSIVIVLPVPLESFVEGVFFGSFFPTGFAVPFFVGISFTLFDFGKPGAFSSLGALPLLGLVFSEGFFSGFIDTIIY